MNRVKNTHLSILLIFAFISIAKCSIPLSCVLLLDSHIQFNLNDLQSSNNYDLDVPVEYKALTPDPTKNYKIAFNFCTKAQPPITDCPSSIYSMGYLYTTDPSVQKNDVTPNIIEEENLNQDLNKCMPLTDKNTSWEYVEAKEDSTNKRILAFIQKKIKNLKKRIFSRILEEEQDKVLGVRGIATNTDEGLYNFEYEIRCPTDQHPEGDFSMKILPNQEFKREDQEVRKVVKIFKYDESGCGNDFSGIIRFLEENSWVFATGSIVLGIFLLFYGYKFIRWALAIVGGVAGFVLVLGTILWFWNYKSGSSAQIFFVIAISFLVGILIGYIFYSFTKIAVMGAGGFLGFLLSNLAIDLIQGFGDVTLAKWLYWTIVIIFIALFTLFGKYMHDHCLILTSSVTGSYLLVRGVGTIAGEYPDDESLIFKIQNGEIGDFPWQWWAYISALLILFAIGMTIQYRQRAQKKKEKGDGKDDWKKGLMNDEFYD